MSLGTPPRLKSFIPPKERIQGFLLLLSETIEDSKEEKYEIGGICMQGELLPPLTNEETQRLLILYKEQGDRNAREKLIVHNLKLVYHMLKPFMINHKNHEEDLATAGMIGLVKGVDTFKMDKKTKLVTYIALVIRNEMLMVIRSISKNQRVCSYDEVFTVNKDGQQVPFLETLGDDTYTPGKDDDLVKMGINDACRKLTPMQQKVLDLRYGLHGQVEHNQREVASIVGISQSYVCRVERDAINKLRSQLI